MLAQNFLSPAALRLTKAQHDALVRTLGMLERGELAYAPFAPIQLPSDRQLVNHQPGLFNMNSWHRTQACGTVHCIGGTAELLGGEGLFDAYEHNEALHDLFYPYPVPMGQWEHITTAQAAMALRSYLTTGAACWAAATRGD